MQVSSAKAEYREERTAMISVKTYSTLIARFDQYMHALGIRVDPVAGGLRTLVVQPIKEDDDVACTVNGDVLDAKAREREYSDVTQGPMMTRDSVASRYSTTH